MRPQAIVQVGRHRMPFPSVGRGWDGIVGDTSHVAGRSGQTVPEWSSPTRSRRLKGRLGCGICVRGQVDGWSDGAKSG